MRKIKENFFRLIDDIIEVRRPQDILDFFLRLDEFIKKSDKKLLEDYLLDYFDWITQSSNLMTGKKFYIFLALALIIGELKLLASVYMLAAKKELKLIEINRRPMGFYVIDFQYVETGKNCECKKFHNIILN